MWRTNTYWFDVAIATARAVVLFLGLNIAACTSNARDDDADTGRVTRVVEDSAVDASRIPAQTLESAAKDLVAFLSGEVGFEKISLADTVVLYLSPEGGGTRATFRRESLRTPAKWVLRPGRWNYSFVPPRTLTKLTAKAGRHLNCLEYPLASRFPHLAKLPHVGVKLEGDTLTSCLATWNATFVFDSIARPPRLVAAVYDQWEW